MTLAMRLRQRGARVTLLEAAPASGGLAGSETIGGHVWDRFYHVILLSDLGTRGLIEELGLGDRLRWGRTRTGFFTDGRLYSMSNSVEFLRFPPLGPADKLRLAGTIFAASRIRDSLPLERELAVDWLKRWSGRRVLERIWLPLLRSKLGENYRLASAAFIWAIIARMYAARRSGLKEEMFGYVDGGYAEVLRALSRRLDELGVTTLNSAAVQRVEDRGEAGVDIRLADGRRLRTAKAVLTLPTGAVAAVCPQLDDDEHERLRGVVYQGIVCGAMLLREPLSPYYVTNITDPGIPFTGIIEMTALVDRSRFGGRSLVYLPRYLAQDDPAWGLDDDEVRRQSIDALCRMYPHFDPAGVVDFKVSRARQVLAIATIDYTARAMPPLQTSLPNVFLVNSAQIASGTLNVNETLGVVARQLPRLAGALGMS
ncbi:MAG: NAD(P)/FAD-dependent oxidoreductase [Limnobacter sp.]|nr:NAD(P)/FAD-dependent oxidoreductase [Limnobacter sp.]